MIPESEEKGYGEDKEDATGHIHKTIFNASLRWKDAFVCSHCKFHRRYLLSSGLYQCAKCRRQTSVTAGTVLHGSHTRLTKRFLAFYLVCMDKRSISATQLSSQLGVTYKTAWYMLKRIHIAMGQRDSKYRLSGIIEFDDAYLGGPTVGEKRGHGTEKAKVFVALSLDGRGNPRYLKLQCVRPWSVATLRSRCGAALRS